ncbi:DVU_1551 family NTP transferase [Paucidesulfovibrio longus]|uniref:DVU_1551 family NTP transferase n=1 Tax=Paucidesulfovibrio longus TaxID=889 RepID=UPI0003B62979|nr:NTP transferase domain-containing protein [Paucidesulfovibrio longus]
MTNVVAIILAAGYSSRMDGFKPLLPLAGEPALSRVVRTFQEAGVQEISVVAGHRQQEIASLCAELNVRVTMNPDFADGMFSSVRAGVRELPPEADGFFLLPVDISLIRPATLRRLILDFAENRALVTHPVFAGEPGHPPLLARELRQPILRHSGEGGLRAVLADYEQEARWLNVADQGVLLDMDLPCDYAALQKRAVIGFPLDAECEALFEICGTPIPAREHSRVVAQVAERMTEALNHVRPAGERLDLALVRSAGLTHDLAKGRPRHAQEGAGLLREHGFDAVADIVVDHPDLHLADAAPITEREIVFLADKFVQGTRIVPIVDRYLAKLERYRDEPQAAAAVRERLIRAEGILLRFCAEAHVRLPDLLLETPE